VLVRNHRGVRGVLVVAWRGHLHRLQLGREVIRRTTCWALLVRTRERYVTWSAKPIHVAFTTRDLGVTAPARPRSHPSHAPAVDPEARRR